MAGKSPDLAGSKPYARANPQTGSARAKLRAAKSASRRQDQNEHSDEEVPHGYAPAAAPAARTSDAVETPEFGISDTLKLVTAEVQNLFQAEKDLFKAKASLAAETAKRALLWIAVAGVAIVAASLAALYAFIALLTPWLGAAGAAAIVACVWLIICGFGMFRARNIINKTVLQLKD